MNAERVTCSWCNKRYIGKVPKGGDGSVLYPRKHKITRRKRTSVFPTYTTVEEVCEGSFTAAKEYEKG